MGSVSSCTVSSFGIVTEIAEQRGSLLAAGGLVFSRTKSRCVGKIDANMPLLENSIVVLDD
jgi:hypothetical protein